MGRSSRAKRDERRRAAGNGAYTAAKHGVVGLTKNAAAEYGPQGLLSNDSFSRKPSAIIGTSPGKIGTAVAQTHLRSIMAFCNSPLMNSIEAYIQFEDGLITDDGEVTNESTKKFLADYMKEYLGYIGRVYTVLPRPDA